MPWRSLGVGLRGGSAKLDGGAMPPGPMLVRLLVHDGFTAAALRQIDVPGLPPSVSIVHPAPGAKVTLGHGLSLAGRARDASGATLAPERLVWRLDGKRVGTGSELRLPPDQVGPGAHEAALDVDGKPAAGSRRVKFTISGKG